MLMVIGKRGAETVGGVLGGFARMLARVRTLATRLLAFSAAYIAATSRRWFRSLAADAKAALQPDALDGVGDDVTVVDPAPAWRTAQVAPSVNAAAINQTKTRPSRVSSQVLFEQIMREIASSPVRLDNHTRKLRSMLNTGVAARRDTGAPDRGRTA
jgi:hypothetical protein